jgi:signal recognition particle subunit SRP72
MTSLLMTALRTTTFAYVLLSRAPVDIFWSPQGFDPANPGPPPDPERWLPVRERSSWKSKRKLKSAPMKGAQGSSAAAAAAAAVVAPAPAAKAEAGGSNKKKGKGGKK